MTTPMIPDYILRLYENEIRAIVKKTNLAISEKYNLNVEDLNTLTEEKIGLKLEIIPEEVEVVKITRIKNRKICEPIERCIARVKSNGIFCQCKFRFKDDKLCNKHGKCANLKFGTIQDPLPEEPFRRKKSIY